MPGSTPSQTVGPFFAFGLPFDGGERLVEDDPDSGSPARCYDGAGEPVVDALVEIWQANRARPLPASRGRPARSCRWRTASTASGAAAPTRTASSASTPSSRAPPRRDAPHINVIVLARGLLQHLFTRIYFPDEEEANAADPLLSSIEDPAMRDTLIAHDLRFDIHLQGENQTAFLDV